MSLHIRFALFSGGSESLLGLDLSFVNLKFIKAFPDELELFIRKLNTTEDTEPDLKTVEGWKRDKFLTQELVYMYALVPIETSQVVDGNIFRRIEEILLIAFPSTFRIFSYLEYADHLATGFFEEMMHTITDHPTLVRSYNNTRHKMLNSIEAEQIIIDSVHCNQTNWLLKRYLEKCQNLQHLKTSISSYHNAFNQRDLSLRIISLTIGLEALILGESEISHRIARLCAVINSNSKEEGRTIYSNVKKLYKVRSLIVHGENHEKYDLTKSYTMLELIVSRTLLEILCHDFKSIIEIDSAVNENGYGLKSNLSSSYFQLASCNEHRDFLTMPL